MGTMSVMGAGGDLKVIWSRDNADEVAQARRTFDEMRGKGFLAYAVRGEKGERDMQITTFNPDAERIIMAPPMKGGAA